jgi:signal transduction histidine kinase
MDRYLFAPLLDIGAAQAAGDELSLVVLRRSAEELADSARGPILRLGAFIVRYQRDWETGTSIMPDARRLRAELERAGESHLLEQEHQIVGGVRHSFQELERTDGISGSAPSDPAVRAVDTAALNEALVKLNLLNLRYVQIAYRTFERVHRATTTFFIVVSLCGILATALLGLGVRQAVAPRVRRMVEAVKSFREGRSPEPFAEDGDDDLAVLAHTLALCFRTIEGRDKERERFLAVAAHELKTPLTSLKGFAEIAIAHRDDPAVRERALSVIDRQSTRLARLVQDLLWSARAGAGQLPFNPAPVDLRALAERVIGEVRLVSKDHDFCLESCPDAHIFGDASLLEQSLWNLLVQASMIAKDHDPVQVGIEGTAARVRFSVAARSTADLPDDLDDLIQPFVALPFESRNGGLRSTGLGLHLVNEIARLHGASFQIERRPGDAIVSCLEFRR